MICFTYCVDPFSEITFPFGLFEIIFHLFNTITRRFRYSRLRISLY